MKLISILLALGQIHRKVHNVYLLYLYLALFMVRMSLYTLVMSIVETNIRSITKVEECLAHY